MLALDIYVGGGSTAMNGGIVYAGGGTCVQAEAGVEDTPEEMFKYLQLETKGVIKDETLPGPGTPSDDDLLAFSRELGTTMYHPVGSCRMGSDAKAVVDPQLRVNGIKSLRVVDASIMPRLISGNTNATTIAIAEKAADMILSSA